MEYVMVKSVDKYFKAFKVGFDMVCAGDALKVCVCELQSFA